MERLHHYKKDILSKQDVNFKLIKQEHLFLDFIENLDTLNASKWNKLYAVLADLNQKTYKNYRIYKDNRGRFYDVTIHKFVTEEEIEVEQSQYDVEAELFDNSQLGKLKRIHFELKQVDIKIEKLQSHKVSLLERQANLLECVYE